MLFPRQLLTIFTGNAEVLEIGVRALRMVMLTALLIAPQSVGAILFQSIGRAWPALLLGLSRQFLILIPLVLILPGFFGMDGIFTAFPLADITATVMTAVWMGKELKRLKLTINQ